MTGSDDRLEAAALRLFEDALDQPSEEREQWIMDQTASDPALRKRVMSLLWADETDDSSLVTGGALDWFRDEEDRSPRKVGQYRVVRLLGRGGMGAVWLGERAAGDFDHRVAIKVVRGVARSAKLAERLRYERQTLAALQHPNIAQLFDGGETEDGEPYFIMEYVDGAPLGDWLEKKPDKKERLRIFRDVCRAVEYAHQQLIVHRDLSPANILITEDGRVKLIDFGISRSFGDSAAGPQMTMTKGFAAPERMKGEPATTLSDIYSLGVILKNMLDAAPVLKDADLSAIAEKASAVEPEERYQSVTAILADLDRYEAGRAVEAKGTRGLYVVGKFIRRRRFAVGASALGMIGVIAALVVTSMLYARAEAERREADARFQQVRELANFMLFDLYDQLEAIPGTTKALSGIADKSRAYLDALKDNRRASTALKLETALGYKRLGDVTGNPIGANLGRREEAGEHLATAIAELEALHAEDPYDPDIARALAESSFSMAVYQFIAIDDNEAAIAHAQRAEELYAGVIAAGHGTDKDEMARIEALSQSGKPLVWKGEGEESVAVIKKARDAAEKFLADHPDNASAKSLAASTNTALAETMMRHFDMQESGDYTICLQYIDRAIDLYKELDAADPDDMTARRNIIAAYFKRALIVYGLEDDETALADLIEAERLAVDFLAQDPDDLGIKRILTPVQEQKAMTLAYLGRHDEAVKIGEKMISDKKELLAGEPDNPARLREVTAALYTLGEIYLVAERTPQACAAFTQSREGYLRLEKDFTLSDFDRETGLERLEELLENCPA
ncbi:protein kinase domain-containing protein [Hyphococcus sp.]|uniref:serine/threonine protein kinase n=1 Tax=Hyphococcus sp. TaxID=2038636 RepID=UPI003D14EB17